MGAGKEWRCGVVFEFLVALGGNVRNEFVEVEGGAGSHDDDFASDDVDDDYGAAFATGA